MLVLSRKLGEKIFIGDNICITVVDIDRGKIRLGIEGQQTRVTCIVDVTPRNPAGYLVARAVARKSIADFMAACRGFSAYLAGKAETPYPRHAAKPPAIYGRLASARDRLVAAGVTRAVVNVHAFADDLDAPAIALRDEITRAVSRAVVRDDDVRELGIRPHFREREHGVQRGGDLVLVVPANDDDVDPSHGFEASTGFSCRPASLGEDLVPGLSPIGERERGRVGLP